MNTRIQHLVSTAFCTIAMMATSAAALDPPSVSIGIHKASSHNELNCTFDVLVFTGSDEKHLIYRSTNRTEVFQRDNAYRIETRAGRNEPPVDSGTFIPGSSPATIRLNNGDGSNTEWDYSPGRKRAHLSLSTVQVKFASMYPDEWKTRYAGYIPRVQGYSLPTFDPKREYPLNKTIRKRRLPGYETVCGRRCRIYSLEFDGLKRGVSDPGDHRKCLIYVSDSGIKMKVDITSTGSSDMGTPVFVRSVTVFRRLELKCTEEPDRFSPPPGTTCEVFSDFTVPIPKNVTVTTVKGRGLKL